KLLGRPSASFSIAETGVSRSETRLVHSSTGCPAPYAAAKAGKSGVTCITKAGVRRGRRLEQPVDLVLVDLDREAAAERLFVLLEEIVADVVGELVSDALDGSLVGGRVRHLDRLQLRHVPAVLAGRNADLALLQLEKLGDERGGDVGGGAAGA